MSVNTLFTWCD